MYPGPGYIQRTVTMKTAVSRNCKARICILLMTLIILAATIPSHAYYYAGGDWGGRDLLLMNGDSLSGDFTNVGQFHIPVGTVTNGSNDNLVVNASRVLIDGTLRDLAVPGYDLKFFSQTELILNGSICSWRSILISANSLIVNGNISALDGTATFPAQPGELRPIDSPIISGGGSISIVPTPIPAATWLLGSGLLGLVGIRRKQQK